jgi:GNAT superfamily N-acetyltransferase
MKTRAAAAQPPAQESSASTRAPSLPLSPIATLRTVELGLDDEALLQRFFDDNPAYFNAVHGEPANPKEALEEIQAQPPAGWSFTKKWMIGYVDPSGSLAAMAIVVTDLLAPGVWQIGLFIVATVRHGSGDAQRLHQGLERWALNHGARWLRLGVVRGNARAERFWEALGYTQVRLREGMPMGKRTNTVRVMVKPLDGSSIDEFLSLVPRDRPD